MKTNIHTTLKIILLVQILLMGYGCTKIPSIEDIKCEEEKLEDRIVGFEYEKDYMRNSAQVRIQSSYTNKCNHAFYVYRGNPYFLRSSVIYARDDKQHAYSDDLYGCESDPGLCILSPPILITKRDWENARKNIENWFFKLEPNQTVEFDLMRIHLQNTNNNQKYFKENTIYLLKITDFSRKHNLGEEYIEPIYFDKKYYRDGDKQGIVWGGKKGTLSKCTFANEKDGVRHYTCEFVKNVLTEEDKWAK